MIEGNEAAAELDIDFAASKEQPAFPLQPMQAGEQFAIRMFACSALRGGRIVPVTTSRWEPGQE